MRLRNIVGQMLRTISHRIAVLLVGLGILLGGPAMASPLSMATVTMMPAMDMHATDYGHGSPHKQMPCDGTDCGCCLAGACAAPVPLNQVGLIAMLGRTLEQEIGGNTIPAGISFPPALPPPIG